MTFYFRNIFFIIVVVHGIYQLRAIIVLGSLGWTKLCYDTRFYLAYHEYTLLPLQLYTLLAQKLFTAVTAQRHKQFCYERSRAIQLHSIVVGRLKVLRHGRLKSSIPSQIMEMRIISTTLRSTPQILKLSRHGFTLDNQDHIICSKGKFESNNMGPDHLLITRFHVNIFTIQFVCRQSKLEPLFGVRSSYFQNFGELFWETLMFSPRFNSLCGNKVKFQRFRLQMFFFIIPSSTQL